MYQPGDTVRFKVHTTEDLPPFELVGKIVEYYGESSDYLIYITPVPDDGQQKIRVPATDIISGV